MIKVHLRDGTIVPVKGGVIAIYTSQTEALVHDVVTATNLEVSNKKEVLASFNAEEVLYFEEEKEEAE